MSAVDNARCNQRNKVASKETIPAPLSICVSIDKTLGKKQRLIGKRKFLQGSTLSEKGNGIFLDPGQKNSRTFGFRVSDIKKTLKLENQKSKLVNRLHLFRPTGKPGSLNSPW